MRFIALAYCLSLMPWAGASAQHGGHGRVDPSTAVRLGPERNNVASLSPHEMTDLQAGRGMGLALPAEVNGYPGPLHALELADALGLTPAQRAFMTEQVASMRAVTVPLGETLIAAERTLDAVFAHGTASEAAVASATEAAALARGRLRFAHLRVHLATRDLMTPEQRAAYSALRGYATR